MIPAYKVADTLDGTLDALANQTVPAAQVVIVLDGHDSELERIARAHPIGATILVEPVCSGGPSRPRNLGNDLLRSDLDLVWFLDGDDIPSPSFIEVLGGVMIDNADAWLVTSDFNRWYANDPVPEPNEPPSDPRVREVPLQQYCDNTGSIVPSFTLWRRSCFSRIRTEGNPFDSGNLCNEDFESFVRVLHLGRVLEVDWIGGNYRIHRDSHSGNALRAWTWRMEACNSLSNWFEQRQERRLSKRFKKAGLRVSGRIARLIYQEGGRSEAIRRLGRQAWRHQDLRSLLLMVALICKLAPARLNR